MATNPFSDPEYGGSLQPFKGELDKPAPATNPFSDPNYGNAPPGGAMSDLGKSVKAGVQKLPGVATGLADLPFALAGARPFTNAANALGEATGFTPGKWADETKFSKGYEDGRAAVDAAWKDGSAADIAGAYLTNPGYTANQVAESLPSMVAGGVASKALLGVGRVAGMAADAVAGTAARAATPGLLARTVGEKWAVPVAAGVGEGAVTAGQQMAEYQGDDQQKNALASLGAGVGTGLIGAGAGRLANKMGLETAETAMARMGSRAGGAGTDVPPSLKRRVLGGMVSEAVLQELPQSAQEQMWNNFANGKPVMEGVDRAGVEGALAGGVMGAGANLRGPGAQPANNAQPAADPAADAPPSPAPQLGYSPLAGTPTVFPDGSVALGSEAELAHRYAPQPVKPSEEMGLNPAAGPLSAAAASAVDSGAYMPPADQAAPAVPEPDQVVLQNRDRTSAASIAQMQDIAANPDYLRVGPSRDMTSGAPVVFGELPPTALLGRPETVVDGKGERMGTQYAVVDAGDLIASNNADGTAVQEYATGAPGKLRSVAGNGRTAGLQAAYQMGTADNYRQELAGDAVALGLDPQAVANMQRPVLVRVMQSADVTNDMGDRTNITATQKLSPLEQAGNDARRLDVRTLAFDEGGSPTLDSIKGFVSAMPVAERGDMLNADGTPTRQAVDRLMAATFKQAYDSDELVQLYAQATDPDARAVMAAAADASGVLANLKGAGEFDVRAAVADAAKMAVNAARQGLKLSDVMQNADIDMNPEAFPVAAFMAENIRTPRKMAEGLRRWGQLALEQARIAAENTRQGGMFGAAPTLSRQEIFARLGDGANPTGQGIAPAAPAAVQSAPEQAALMPAPQSPQSNPNVDPNGIQSGQAAVERHPSWRKNAIQAGRVARALGLEPKGKRLAQMVAEIDAHDAAIAQPAPTPEVPQLDLAAYTAEEGRAAAQAQEAADQRKAQEGAAFDAAEKAVDERKRIAQASVMAADEFELGQKPMDSLTGQEGMFDTPAAEAKPVAAQDAAVTPAKSAKKPSVSARKKQEHEAKLAEQADYFAPGNIVKSYTGHERVMSYSPPDADGNWSVTVQPVEQQGGVWLSVPGAKQSQHSTQPDARAMKAGPVERAPKSATDNNSNFDPASPDIRFSRAPSTQKGQASAQPQDFVPNADGGLDYGEITPEMGKVMRRQAGKIRLQQGVQNADGTGWGLAHIEARHGKQIKNLGYGSVSDFVAESVRGFDQIWQAGKTIQLVMARTGKASRATFLQLEIQKDGDFYRVNSVFPVSDSYLEGKAKKEGWVQLWSRYPVPADASGASGFVGQSPKAGETAPMVSDQSGSASVAPKGATANYARADEGMSPDLARAILALGQPAQSATKESVRAAVRELVNGGGLLPNRLGRVVVATAAEIKAHWEPLIGTVAMESEGVGRAQGFYDPKTKTVFLIADHIQAGDELGVVAHELMHKHGPAVLGEQGWSQLHAAISDWATAPAGSMERKVYDEAASRVQASGAELSNQELFPYAVQVALEMGVRPNAIAPKGSIERWLGQVRAALRHVWSKIATQKSDFNSLDLVNLAFAIAQRENPAMGTSLDAQGATMQDTEEPLFSRTAPAQPTAIQSSMGELTPEQASAYQRVAGTKRVPTLKERFAMLKANFGLKARQALVDQFAAIKQLDQHAYMQARMSKASDGTLEAALLYGKPFMNGGVPDVNMADGGFAKVLASLDGEHDRLLMWVAAQRADRLKAEGKENLMTDDDISSLKTLNAGKMKDGRSRPQVYAKALGEINAYNEAMLKIGMESGLIDQAAYEIMKDQPYVPFYRLMGDENLQGPRFSSGLTNQQAFKKLKGGSQQLNADLLENMLLSWSSLLQASAKNRAALASMDAAEKMAIAYKVPATTHGKATKGAVKVMRDGVTEHWMVEDPYLLEAIGALHYTVSPLMKPLVKMKQILTMAVTVNPTFKIRNLIRDSISAIAQSELGYNPAANVKNAWKLTASDSQMYASMLAGGGIIKFGTQENTDRLRAQVAKLGGTVLDKTGTQKLMGQVSTLWEVYSEFGDRTENVNRAALYDQLIKKGKSHAEASFMARDLMDFSMGGGMPLVRFLTQTVPFLNARLVGLDKLGRAAMEDPRKFATMAAAVSIASVTLMMIYGDDDDWKKREDWDRDTYWWFKVGDKAFRIPKPFEVGAIGTMAERTAELMFSKEMTNKRFAERMAHMFSQTFAFDPVPQAIKPLWDVYSNKDSFTKRAIESQADQRLRPEDRYNERTSEVARLLGQLGLPEPSQLIKGTYVGLSPKQIDHLIRGYFSWVGVTATTAADMLVRPALDRGERPALRLKDAFVIGNFVESLPTGSSRYVSQMYEQSRQVQQAYASYREAIKLGDMDKARSIQAEDGDKLRSRIGYDHAAKQMSEINQRAKKVEADRSLSAADKRERLDALEQRRGAIAKRAVERAGV